MDARAIRPEGRQVFRGTTVGGNATARVAPDVWYRFELDAPANVEILLEGDDDWDTYLLLYSGRCGAVRPVASNDDFEGIGRSRIEPRLLPAGAYFVVVSGFHGQAAGGFRLIATFSPEEPAPVDGPANDDCEEAQAILAEGQQVLEGTTVGANGTVRADPGEPDEFVPDVWYRFLTDGLTRTEIVVEGENRWDTYLFWYSGRCGALEELGSNDDDGFVGRSRVGPRVLPAGVYYVAVSGFRGRATGAFELTAVFEETRPFNEARFGATHNSYSGGARGSIEAQLDVGIRLIELDIHDDDYRNRGDYRVGHDGPNDEVSHDIPNPAGDALTPWLEAIADWSSDNRDHAPITVVLDLKDDLTDNYSFSEGNLGALNAQLRAAFGARLILPEEIGPRGVDWPTVAELRGRVVVVLSGDDGDRLAYRRDRGHRPAVAINTAGQVIELHDSGDRLWYWTGRYDRQLDTVDWTAHGRFDTGYTPAVDIDEAGVVVEVHRSEDRPTLYYRVGQMRADGTGVDWGESHDYDRGVMPTVRYVGPGEILEIHQSQNGRQRWFWVGAVNAEAQTIEWGEHARTDLPFHAKEQDDAVIGGRQRTLSVWRREADDHLRYNTAVVADAPIRYEPVAFVEGQPDDDWIDAAIHFFAAETGRDGEAFVQNWQQRGGVGRLWGFDEPNAAFFPNFPATDTPLARWYQSYLRDIGAVD